MEIAIELYHGNVRIETRYRHYC